MTNRNIVRNFGYVSRMDNLQAGILNFRLERLKDVILRRRKKCKIIFKKFKPKIYIHS